jgi:hypothetical protein
MKPSNVLRAIGGVCFFAALLLEIGEMKKNRHIENKANEAWENATAKTDIDGPGPRD